MNVDDDFANQSGSSTHSHSNPLRLRVPAAGGWLLPHGEAGIAPSWQPWRPQDVVWGTTNPIGWCGTQNKADYVNHGFLGVDVFFCCFLFLWFWVSEIQFGSELTESLVMSWKDRRVCALVCLFLLGIIIAQVQTCVEVDDCCISL